MVLSISLERYKDFQKETIVDPELKAVLTMKKKWMTRHKEASCYRGKTLLDIQ